MRLLTNDDVLKKGDVIYYLPLKGNCTLTVMGGLIGTSVKEFLVPTLSDVYDRIERDENILDRFIRWLTKKIRG